jgi:upstream activation factor subunit UAF30
MGADVVHSFESFLITAGRTVMPTVKKVAAKKPAASPAARKSAAKKPIAKKAAVRKPAAKQAKSKAPQKKGALAAKRQPNPAFMKAVQPSPSLAAIIGDQAMPRTEVTKKVWDYIKRQGLQDATNKRMINADEKLRELFGGRNQVSMFEMTKLVNAHLT